MADSEAPRPPHDAPEATPPGETIDPESEVDEALYETFPASDAPGYAGGAVTPTDYEDDDGPDAADRL